MSLSTSRFLGVSSGLEGFPETAAESVALSESQWWRKVGVVGGDVNLPVRAGFVIVNVVLRQAVQLCGIVDLDDSRVVRDVPVEPRLVFGELVLKLLELRSSRIVLVHAR